MKIQQMNGVVYSYMIIYQAHTHPELGLSLEFVAKKDYVQQELSLRCSAEKDLVYSSLSLVTS